MFENVIWLDDVGMSDVEKVGGKNASLGEMISGLALKALEFLEALRQRLRRLNPFYIIQI